MEIHLRYYKLVAEHYEGYAKPFCVIAHCTDGHAYEVSEVEVMRCRCAKWRREAFHYEENRMYYHRDTWTGPGSGIPIVIDDEQRIR